MHLRPVRAWADAKAACSSAGMQLVTLYDLAHADALHAVVSAYTSSGYWVGLNERAEQGQWAWDDGQPLSWSRWSNGEPSSGGDCVQVGPGGGASWSARDCSAVEAPFVCSLRECCGQLD